MSKDQVSRHPKSSLGALGGRRRRGDHHGCRSRCSKRRCRAGKAGQVRVLEAGVVDRPAPGRPTRPRPTGSRLISRAWSGGTAKDAEVVAQGRATGGHRGGAVTPAAPAPARSFHRASWHLPARRAMANTPGERGHHGHPATHQARKLQRETRQLVLHWCPRRAGPGAGWAASGPDRAVATGPGRRPARLRRG